MATLADIMTKVRRITRTPSSSQMTDSTLVEYINAFLLNDVPETLRLFTYKTTMSFYTQPYVNKYATNTVRSEDALYDFKNAYITTDIPVYIDGRKAYFTQSREDFFNMYPHIIQKTKIGTGDGVTTAFAGTLTSKPVLQNEVSFTSYDANNEQLVLTDIPEIGAITGLPTVLGDLVYPNSTASLGTINYKTGVYSFNFINPPDNGASVYSHTKPYTEGRPDTVLYFNNTFFIWPVPDGTYKITMDVYIKPTEFDEDDTAARPILDQHWQYIALGASKKIFEDRMDTESLQKIMPLLQEQEDLVGRRTLVQKAKERTATIYTGHLSSYDWGWNNYD